MKFEIDLPESLQEEVLTLVQANPTAELIIKKLIKHLTSETKENIKRKKQDLEQPPKDIGEPFLEIKSLSLLNLRAKFDISFLTDHLVIKNDKLAATYKFIDIESIILVETPNKLKPHFTFSIVFSKKSFKSQIKNDEIIIFGVEEDSTKSPTIIDRGNLFPQSQSSTSKKMIQILSHFIPKATVIKPALQFRKVFKNPILYLKTTVITNVVVTSVTSHTFSLGVTINTDNTEQTYEFSTIDKDLYDIVSRYIQQTSHFWICDVDENEANEITKNVEIVQGEVYIEEEDLDFTGNGGDESSDSTSDGEGYECEFDENNRNVEEDEEAEELPKPKKFKPSEVIVIDDDHDDDDDNHEEEDMLEDSE